MLRNRFRDAEVDDLRDRSIVLNSDQDVRRFEIAVNDALLVGMLNAIAHLQEQIDAAGDRQLVFVAVRRNAFATDILHDEIRTALRGCTGVEDARDGRMIHDRQRLALGFEPRDDLRGIHTGLDDLQGDLTTNGVSLLGEPHFAHPAFADAPQEAVRPNHFDRARRRRLRLGDVVDVRRAAVRQIAHVEIRSSLSVVTSESVARVCQRPAAVATAVRNPRRAAIPACDSAWSRR